MTNRKASMAKAHTESYTDVAITAKCNADKSFTAAEQMLHSHCQWSCVSSTCHISEHVHICSVLANSSVWMKTTSTPPNTLCVNKTLYH